MIKNNPNGLFNKSFVHVESRVVTPINHWVVLPLKNIASAFQNVLSSSAQMLKALAQDGSNNGWGFQANANSSSTTQQSWGVKAETPLNPSAALLPKSASSASPAAAPNTTDSKKANLVGSPLKMQMSPKAGFPNKTEGSNSKLNASASGHPPIEAVKLEGVRFEADHSPLSHPHGERQFSKADTPVEAQQFYIKPSFISNPALPREMKPSPLAPYAARANARPFVSNESKTRHFANVQTPASALQFHTKPNASLNPLQPRAMRPSPLAPKAATTNQTTPLVSAATHSPMGAVPKPLKAFSPRPASKEASDLGLKSRKAAPRRPTTKPNLSPTASPEEYSDAREESDSEESFKPSNRSSSKNDFLQTQSSPDSPGNFSDEASTAASSDDEDGKNTTSDSSSESGRDKAENSKQSRKSNTSSLPSGSHSEKSVSKEQGRAASNRFDRAARQPNRAQSSKAQSAPSSKQSVEPSNLPRKTLHAARVKTIPDGEVCILKEAVANIQTELKSLSKEAHSLQDSRQQLQALNNLFRNLGVQQTSLEALGSKKDVKLKNLHDQIEQVSSSISRAAINELFRYFKLEAQQQFPTTQRFADFEYAVKTEAAQGISKAPIQSVNELVNLFGVTFGLLNVEQIRELRAQSYSQGTSPEMARRTEADPAWKQLVKLNSAIAPSTAPNTSYHEFQNGPYCQTTAVNNFLGAHLFSPELAEALLARINPTDLGKDAPRISNMNRELVHEMLMQKIEEFNREMKLEPGLLEQGLEDLRVKTFTLKGQTPEEAKEFAKTLIESDVQKVIFSFVKFGRDGHVVALQRSESDPNRWVWLDGNTVPIEVNLEGLFEAAAEAKIPFYIDLSKRDLSNALIQKFGHLTKKLEDRLNPENPALEMPSISKGDFVELRNQCLLKLLNAVRKAPLMKQLNSFQSSPVHSASQQNSFSLESNREQLLNFCAICENLTSENIEKQNRLTAQTRQIGTQGCWETIRDLAHKTGQLDPASAEIQTSVLNDCASMLSQLEAGQTPGSFLDDNLKKDVDWWGKEKYRLDAGLSALKSFENIPENLGGWIDQVTAFAKQQINADASIKPLVDERFANFAAEIKSKLSEDAKLKFEYSIVDGERSALPEQGILSSSPAIEEKRTKLYKQMSNLHEKRKTLNQNWEAWMGENANVLIELEKSLVGNSERISTRIEEQMKNNRIAEEFSKKMYAMLQGLDRLIAKVPAHAHEALLKNFKSLSKCLVAKERIDLEALQGADGKARAARAEKDLKNSFALQFFDTSSNNRAFTQPIQEEFLNLSEELLGRFKDRVYYTSARA